MTDCALPRLDREGDPGGAPVFRAADLPKMTLFGRPIIVCEQCQSLGTAGDVILADLSQYLCITKGGMQTAQSIHVRFIYDETVFRFVYRVDGQPMWSSALTPYKGSDTIGPFFVVSSWIPRTQSTGAAHHRPILKDFRGSGQVLPRRASGTSGGAPTLPEGSTYGPCSAVDVAGASFWMVICPTLTD